MLQIELKKMISPILSNASLAREADAGNSLKFLARYQERLGKATAYPAEGT